MSVVLPLALGPMTARALVSFDPPGDLNERLSSGAWLFSAKESCTCS